MSSEHIPTQSMARHPDILAMSGRYERMAETTTAQIADGLTVLSGLFVALAPWIVGFSDSAALVRSNLVVGIAVALLGAGFAMAYERTHRLTWVCPVLGAWTIVSVWVVSGAEATTPIILSNVLGGVAVLLLGIADFAPKYLARREVRG